MTAVRSVSTLLDHTTATVSVVFSWSMAQTVKVYLLLVLPAPVSLSLAGWTSDICQPPCVNGTCNETTEQCDCFPGFTGVSCDEGKFGACPEMHGVTEDILC